MQNTWAAMGERRVHHRIASTSLGVCEEGSAQCLARGCSHVNLPVLISEKPMTEILHIACSSSLISAFLVGSIAGISGGGGGEQSSSGEPLQLVLAGTSGLIVESEPPQQDG